MRLLRFKDNTYTWVAVKETSPIMSETEAIAYGVWKLKVKRDEIQLGLINLKAEPFCEKDNVAIFSNANKQYLYTTKLKKEIDTTLDENGGYE